MNRAIKNISQTLNINVISLCILTLLLSSCGYKLIGSATSLPDHIKTVFIPVFTNDSKEPGVETYITASVKERFIVDGRLNVLESDKADLYIWGKVKNITLKPVSFDTSDNASEYWIITEVEISATDRKTGKPIIKRSLTTKWDYKTTSDITSNETNRLEAFKTAFEDFSKQLISLIVEGF